jgi:hypothetical protein
MGSLMMMSPLRILMLYRHPGFVQTHALYSIEAPWLPKSESGTRSPSPHLRHRGKISSKAVRLLLPAQGLFNRAHRPTPALASGRWGWEGEPKEPPPLLSHPIASQAKPYVLYHKWSLYVTVNTFGLLATHATAVHASRDTRLASGRPGNAALTAGGFAFPHPV